MVAYNDGSGVCLNAINKILHQPKEQPSISVKRMHFGLIDDERFILFLIPISFSCRPRPMVYR